MAEGGTYRVIFSKKRHDASIAMPTPGGQETNTMRKHKPHFKPSPHMHLGLAAGKTEAQETVGILGGRDHRGLFMIFVCIPVFGDERALINFMLGKMINQF